MKRYSQQQIGDLLDKFMDGLTTPEEETVLSDYFRTQEVPEEWEDYRLLFDYFDRGMEGELLSPQASRLPLMHQMGRRWWGIAAAAAITAVIVTLAVFRAPESTISQPPTIVKTEPVDTPADTPAVVVPEVEMQQLAVSSPPKTAVRSKVSSTASHSRRLQAENDRLARENERLQRELEDLKRRAFIIDIEANGFKAVMGEDGHIVFIDMEQEIENEFNHQTTNNIPEI